MRERVNAILPELQAIAAAARPLLHRAEASTRELTDELERDSSGYQIEIADGMFSLAGAPNGSTELYDAMRVASDAIHPEDQTA
jgi:hypothetical protein